MDELMEVQDGQIVSMDYILHVDGKQLDASNAGEPLQFLQGSGQIIRGLEKALYGMKIGESKDVVVAPEEGYGLVEDSAFVDVPRSQVPPQIPLRAGMELPVRAPDGSVVTARVESINATRVRLNLNHPLAGKELHFAVKIADLRLATDEEKGPAQE
jgi:FKBP-type peptidyl-prolyl cis-trans isomerase SlyD